MKTLLTILAFCAISTLATAQNPPENTLNIHMLDYCDPDSFNAVVGEGTCIRDTAAGLITFSGFSAEATAEKSVGAWRFTPLTAKTLKGARLRIDNLGGEVHTFTEVKHFGGGFVDFLNQATGNLKPAPECAKIVNGQLVPQPAGPDNQFLAPGTHKSHRLDPDETVVRYQCCIHPWMRITIRTAEPASSDPGAQQ